MVLASRIAAQRKQKGWSQEELAERMDVSRQSVSKWESGASTPDLNRVIQLAELFQVTTDFLLKEEELSVPDDVQESAKPSGSMNRGADFAEQEIPEVKIVSAEEAGRFLGEAAIFGKKIAKGVALCILSPVLLILFAGFSEGRNPLMSENAAAAVGTGILILMVALAVGIFIRSSMQMNEFEYFKEGHFKLEEDAAALAGEAAREFQLKYSGWLTSGVILCIVAVVPLIVSGAVGFSDRVYIVMTALLLVLVACGVYRIVAVGTVKGFLDQMQKQGEYAPELQSDRKRLEKIGGIYWPIVVAIYLVWSFLSGDWQITWVIWPVAGLICAALNAALKKVR